MIFDLEQTDTFGGEANYSWVLSDVIRVDSDSQAAIMRAAKRAMGLSGIRGRTESWGDTFAFRPYGICQILFVTWHDCGEPGGCARCKPLRKGDK